MQARAVATLRAAPSYSAGARGAHARSQSSVGAGTGPFASPARAHGHAHGHGHSALGHAASRGGSTLHHHSLPLPHSQGRSGAPSATASLPPSGSVTPTTLTVDDLNNSGSAFRHAPAHGHGLGLGLGMPVWSRSGSVVAFDTATVDDSALLLNSQGRGGPVGGGAAGVVVVGGGSMRRSASAASSLGLSAGFFVPARPPGFEELGSAHAHAAPFAPMRLVAHQRTPSLYRQDSEDDSADAAAADLHDQPTSEVEDDDHDDDDNYMLYGRAMQDD